MAKRSSTWQENCRLLIGGAVVVPARVSAWSFDGLWGGEVVFEHQANVSVHESASLALEFDGQHPIRVVSVSHRAARQTTIHFEGSGTPPFNAHGAEEEGLAGPPGTRSD